MHTARRSFQLSLRFYSTIVKIMEHEQIVPDVIDLSPHEIIEISYPIGFVHLGTILTPTQVKDKPTVKWTAENTALYTLCMTDPDAPSRKEPKLREWHHWLVGNIPGDDVVRGETLSAYIGAVPSQGSGLHRYVFLVYRQRGRISFKDVLRLTDKSSNYRGGFSIRNFAAKYMLGNPIAANFLQAEFDDYVPFLYKQLGAK